MLLLLVRFCFRFFRHEELVRAAGGKSESVTSMCDKGMALCRSLVEPTQAVEGVVFQNLACDALFDG